jgi:hypothetical protein
MSAIMMTLLNIHPNECEKGGIIFRRRLQSHREWWRRCSIQFPMTETMMVFLLKMDPRMVIFLFKIDSSDTGNYGIILQYRLQWPRVLWHFCSTLNPMTPRMMAFLLNIDSNDTVNDGIIVQHRFQRHREWWNYCSTWTPKTATIRYLF